MTSRPLPSPTALSRPFWEAAREHRLKLQRCATCSAFRWTPQALCPECWSDAYEWTQVSGRGTLYSYTIVHRAPTTTFVTPYIVAVVALEEGPLMLTQLIDCDPSAVSMEMPVEVAFQTADENVSLYCFRPSSAGASMR